MHFLFHDSALLLTRAPTTTTREEIRQSRTPQQYKPPKKSRRGYEIARERDESEGSPRDEWGRVEMAVDPSRECDETDGGGGRLERHRRRGGQGGACRLKTTAPSMRLVGMHACSAPDSSASIEIGGPKGHADMRASDACPLRRDDVLCGSVRLSRPQPHPSNDVGPPFLPQAPSHLSNPSSPAIPSCRRQKSI